MYLRLNMLILKFISKFNLLINWNMLKIARKGVAVGDSKSLQIVDCILNVDFRIAKTCHQELIVEHGWQNIWKGQKYLFN